MGGSIPAAWESEVGTTACRGRGLFLQLLQRRKHVFSPQPDGVKHKCLSVSERAGPAHAFPIRATGSSANGGSVRVGEEGAGRKRPKSDHR